MAKYCIGIDLGGTFIKFGLLDENMRASGIFQLPTPSDRQGVVDQMISGAKQLIACEGIDKRDIHAVGIGSPGPLNIAAGVVIDMPNIPGFAGCPLRDLVGSALGLKAVLENDANAAGYGEYIAGAGAGTQDMVLLTLGTGVGSGIVIGGKVLHGAHDIGAELGHMIIVPDGELCACGQHGCLEKYTSSRNISQQVCKLIERGEKSSLSKVLAAKGDLDAKDILDAAKAGDALAAGVWDKTAYYLALACVNICRIFDPEEIVFAGGMAKAGEDLLNPVRKHFQKQHWKLAPIKTRLAIAKLGSDAGVIGAAGVAWKI